MCPQRHEMKQQPFSDLCAGSRIHHKEAMQIITNQVTHMGKGYLLIIHLLISSGKI